MDQMLQDPQQLGLVAGLLIVVGFLVRVFGMGIKAIRDGEWVPKYVHDRALQELDDANQRGQAAIDHANQLTDLLRTHGWQPPPAPSDRRTRGGQ